MQAISKRFHYFILFKIKEGKGEEPNYIHTYLASCFMIQRGCLYVFFCCLSFPRSFILTGAPYWVSILCGCSVTEEAILAYPQEEKKVGQTQKKSDIETTSTAGC